MRLAPLLTRSWQSPEEGFQDLNGVPRGPDLVVDGVREVLLFDGIILALSEGSCQELDAIKMGGQCVSGGGGHAENYGWGECGCLV